MADGMDKLLAVIAEKGFGPRITVRIEPYGHGEFGERGTAIQKSFGFDHVFAAEAPDEIREAWDKLLLWMADSLRANLHHQTRD